MMSSYGSQRLGPSPLAGPSHQKGSNSSPPSLRGRTRNNSLDPVPEDSSLGRKRSLRAQQAQSQAQYQKDQARARRRSEVGGSLRLMTDMGDQSGSYSAGLLSPTTRPSKLPREDLLRPPSPTSLPMARPGRALSEARITLERERQRVERDKTRPDWVIDLDDMEVGIKEWTRPTKARVVLILGEPDGKALRPILASPDFTNTLILLAKNPSVGPSTPVASSSSQSKDLGRLAPGSAGGNRISRQFGQRPNSSSRSPLSQSPASPHVEKDAKRLNARELVAELGPECVAEVQFLTPAKEGKTVGEIIKQAVDTALAWKKKRKALQTLREPTLPGLGSRRGSAHSDLAAGSGPGSSRSHSPMHSRRPSVELEGGRDNRRSTLSRSFSSVLSMATVVAKEETETGSQDGSGDGPNQRVRGLDAVVNFLPQDDRADSMQGALQNVLVTTTALLPFMPSSNRISPHDSLEEKKRRNSTYSLVSSARTSSFSSNIFPTGIMADMPQTLIHVLPAVPSPTLIKAIEAYLKSLFPRPALEGMSAHAAPRAFVLGSRVLSQPMKRASDMSPISGLALTLSGAISCHSHDDKMYLDDLRSCRFESGSPDRSDEETQVVTAPAAFFDQYSIATGITDGETDSIRSLEPSVAQSSMAIPEIQVDHRGDIPSTPPLDFDNETSASSVDNSTHNPSVEGFSGPDVVVLSHSMISSASQEGGKSLKKKKSWLGKLFSKSSSS